MQSWNFDEPHTLAADLLPVRPARQRIVFSLETCCFTGLSPVAQPSILNAEMARRPVMLLVIGGAIGPIAAVFWAMDMGIFYLTLKSGNRKLAKIRGWPIRWDDTDWQFFGIRTTSRLDKSHSARQ